MKRYLLIISLLCTFAGTVWAQNSVVPTMQVDVAFQGRWINKAGTYIVQSNIGQEGVAPGQVNNQEQTIPSNTINIGNATYPLTLTVSDGKILLKESNSNTDVTVNSDNFQLTFESSTKYITAATVAKVDGTTVSGCTVSGTYTKKVTVRIPKNTDFGKVSLTMTLNKPLELCTINGIADSYVDDGVNQPEPTVTLDGQTLTKDVHYTVGYTVNVNNGLGSGTVTVTGIGEYTGSKSKNYNIRLPNLSDFKQLSDGAYEIATPQDMTNLARYVNQGNPCSGITFRQTDNIAYRYDTDDFWSNKTPYENNYTPVGTLGRPFKGTFDGAGLTISGIRICKKGTSDDDSSLGLFGFVSTGGVVKNVNLNDASITGHQNVGGIVGFLSEGTVQDCNVLNQVSILHANSNSDNHGGIVGQVDDNGVVTRCISYAGPNILTGANGISGGIVGYMAKGIVSQCLFYSSINAGNKAAGGIVGSFKAGNVTDCYIKALNIEGKSGSKGPVFGENTSGTVTRSYYNTSEYNNYFQINLGSGVNLLTPRGEGVVLGNSGITTYDTGVDIDEGASLGVRSYYTAGMDFCFSYSGEIPEGQVLAGFTVNGVSAATDNGDGTWTITMPNRVTIIEAIIRKPIAYIDVDGKQKTVTDYTTIKSSSIVVQTFGTAGKESWYVVSAEGVTTGALKFRDSHTHLILCDGASLTATDDFDYDGMLAEGELTIYGQAGGTGSLTANYTGPYSYKGISTNGDITILGGCVTASGDYAIYSMNGNITILGGTVTATGSKFGIQANSGDISILSGQVNATGETYGIYAFQGSITLGWTNANDRICASSYGKNILKTFSVRDGQGLKDADGNIYKRDDLTDSKISSLSGKTLQPVASLIIDNNVENDSKIYQHDGLVDLEVTLQGRTLYKDGDWNTLCLPFDLDAAALAASPLAGAEIRWLSDASLGGSTLTLNFTAVSAIEAGRPYIIKWDKTDSHITNPAFTGITIKNDNEPCDYDFGNGKGITCYGTYNKITYPEENHSVLFLGANNKLCYPKAGATIGACRGYFELYGITAGEVTATKMWFGDSDSEDGIIDIEHGTLNIEHSAGAVYNLSGQKLSKPQKGINIVNGKKVLY